MLIVAAGLLLTSSLGFAQSKAGTATFTATAVDKKEGAPSIARDDVQVFQGKERKQLGEWKQDSHLFLAILIDDAIDTNAAGQWEYLKEFILSQPAGSSIAVGYLRNNVTTVAQDFTGDHQLAAKALRIPLGTGALGSSPYLGAMDMLKRWPQTGPRRSLLIISSGIDYFRGPGFGPFSPDLDPLIQRAQRQNTNVWTIYYPSSGHRGHSFFLATNAQNNLDKLAQDTGGEAFYLGTSEPVSLKPYLEELAQHLNNQYLVTIAGSGGAKGKFASAKVKAAVPGVEFLVPSSVYFPPSGQ
jgi:hypothetical protein